MSEPAHDAQWTPEGLRRQVREHEGVYDSYRQYADGTDAGAIQWHAIVDDDYALAYARNLFRHLHRLALPHRGDILDVGCGPGTVTNALARASGSAATGIDLAPEIVAAAARRYPDTAFAECSADELDAFADGRFRLIHAREFYPFTRTRNIELHAGFLRAFLPKLAPGGLAVAVQIVDRRGLADTRAELARQAREMGYAASGRMVLAPLRLYRRLGDAAAGPVLRPAVVLACSLLEAVRPGSVTYVYWYRKDAR